MPQNWFYDASLNETPQVEANGLSHAQRKKLSGKHGWSHRGFLAKLAKICPFDLVMDVPPDMMHLSMNLIKGIPAGTQNVF